MESWKLKTVTILAFGTALLRGAELLIGGGHEVFGYNIVLATVGCAYFIFATRILKTIQGGAS